MSITGRNSNKKNYETLSPRRAPGIDNTDQSDLDQVEQELEEVENLTGMDLNHFDDIEIDPSLPDHVPAATKYGEVPSSLTGRPLYSNTVLSLNDSFTDLPKSDRLDVLGHEGIHSAQFNNYLEPQLSQKFDPETARFLQENLNSDTQGWKEQHSSLTPGSTPRRRDQC